VTDGRNAYDEGNTIAKDKNVQEALLLLLQCVRWFYGDQGEYLLCILLTCMTALSVRTDGQDRKFPQLYIYMI